MLTATCTKARIKGGKVKIEKLINPKNLKLGILLRDHNTDNVHTYRIPGLVTTNKGTLLACYDVRHNTGRDLQGNIDIGISRSCDGGQNWEPMQIAIDMKKWGNLPEKFNGVSDACLLIDRNTNNIFLCGLWMHGVIDDNGVWVENLNEDSTNWNHQWLTKGSQPGWNIKQTSQFLLSKSTDDGLTWEEPVNLTKMCKRKEWWLWAPAPGNGITMQNGTLVLPTQGRDQNGLPFSNITYSTDGGKTWETSNPAYTNTTECAVVEIKPNTLMLNMRDNRNWNEKGDKNGRAVFITSNMGKTWQKHTSSHNALIEPTCMASLIKHDSLLIFSNPNSKFHRKDKTIKISFDLGKTWPEKYWFLYDEGHSAGYSSQTIINNKYIGIVYECSQAQLAFQRFKIDELINPK